MWRLLSLTAATRQIKRLRRITIVRWPMATPRMTTALLPQYNPIERSSFNCVPQFVRKVNLLRRMYGWTNEVNLFAAIGDLNGPSRRWFDAMERSPSTKRRRTMRWCNAGADSTGTH